MEDGRIYNPSNVESLRIWHCAAGCSEWIKRQTRDLQIKNRAKKILKKEFPKQGHLEQYDPKHGEPTNLGVHAGHKISRDNFKTLKIV
jgi:hypothetical protein